MRNSIVTFFYVSIVAAILLVLGQDTWDSWNREAAAVPLWAVPGQVVEHLSTRRRGVVVSADSENVTTKFPTGQETVRLIDVVPIFNR